MNEIVEGELRRLGALLAPSRVDGPLEKVPCAVDPATLGALAGVSYRTSSPEILVSVYVFESQRAHPDATAVLQARFGGEGVRVVSGSNGRLLFFGHTRSDGPDPIKARFRLSGIAGAFAGDE